MADGLVVPDPILLYADGSFSQDAGIGAWAFRAPALNLEGVGSSDGKTITRFEFLAVLHGLEAVVAVDSSGTPVQVFSDCNSTVSLINLLRTGSPVKDPGQYQDRADLLPRLQAVLAHRQIQVTRYGRAKIEHQACHRTAITRLRAEVDKDPRVQHRLALNRNRSRLNQLVGERGTVLNRLEKLDEEISLLQLEIELLERSLRDLTKVPTDDVFASLTTLPETTLLAVKSNGEACLE